MVNLNWNRRQAVHSSKRSSEELGTKSAMGKAKYRKPCPEFARPFRDSEGKEYVTLYFDGACNFNGDKLASIGCVLVSRTGFIATGKRIQTGSSSPQAEANALLFGLQLALRENVRELVVIGDNENTIKLALGHYKAKSENIKLYIEEIHNQLDKFRDVQLVWRPREFNKHADWVAAEAKGNQEGKYLECIGTIT